MTRPGMPAWAAHPAFAPYAGWCMRLDPTGSPPPVAMLAAWAREAGTSLPDGRRLAFRPAAGRRPAALAYESAIARTATVPLRDGDWHDAFNALTWLALPRTRAALNARHVAAGAAATPNRRSRVRDAATLLDESGLLLACADPALARLLAAGAWRGLFVDRADRVARSTVAVVIGHGLLAKLRAPFRAITARVLVLDCEPRALPAPADLATLDRMAAAAVLAPAFAPASLPPLPVAGLPGWDAERLGERLLDDVSVFRPRGSLVA